MSHTHYAPHGYRSVTPYFTVEDPQKLIEFIQHVFAGRLMNRSSNREGTVTHAEMQIGDTIIELSAGSDRFPPRTNTLHVFVEDADGCYGRALQFGAKSLYEPADMPYGERSGGVEDPFGNHWYIATFAGGEGQGYYK
ncbi:VOC family protein [Paenibacillus allorhizosphaerae]|uniref:VOC domain-containing protein n=1 Tax=Paenibacillus allorhizosphaerae TaxID=2849866 RepID=A0ABM8VQY6_9BACL|nr:VOC family protein [Paenibacillus allorhizosphaerae]CAG7654796.1 hypothetical protein PAECIP111802_05881 [Paenibacillus allorhizosphaerae]